MKPSKDHFVMASVIWETVLACYAKSNSEDYLFVLYRSNNWILVLRAHIFIYLLIA